MSDTQQVSGVCSEVSERGDWTTFHIDIGKQYPVKLATKKEELVQLGRAASKDGGEFIWTYTESEGAENPHTGKPYINRYLEAVAPRDGSSEPAKQVDATVTQPVSRDDRLAFEKQKDRLIAREACLHAAGRVFAGAANAGENPDEIIKRHVAYAARLEVWLYRDIDEVPFT